MNINAIKKDEWLIRIINNFPDQKHIQSSYDSSKNIKM